MYSLKSRLLLFFILAIGIIIILQTIIFQYIIKSTINRNSSTYFQEIITQASKHLDLQFQHCEELADRIDSNQVIINLIKDVENKRITFDVAKYGIIRETGKFIDPINMDGVYLFMIDNKPINCFYTYPKLEMDSYSRYLLHPIFR